MIAKLSNRKKLLKRTPALLDEDIVEINTITKGKKYNPIERDFINGSDMVLIIDDTNKKSWYKIDLFDTIKK